jgi:hypothetical protein
MLHPIDRIVKPTKAMLRARQRHADVLRTDKRFQCYLCHQWFDRCNAVWLDVYLPKRGRGHLIGRCPECTRKIREAERAN